MLTQPCNRCRFPSHIFSDSLLPSVSTKSAVVHAFFHFKYSWTPIQFVLTFSKQSGNTEKTTKAGLTRITKYTEVTQECEEWLRSHTRIYFVMLNMWCNTKVVIRQSRKNPVLSQTVMSNFPANERVKIPSLHIHCLNGWDQQVSTDNNLFQLLPFHLKLTKSWAPSEIAQQQQPGKRAAKVSTLWRVQ